MSTKPDDSLLGRVRRVKNWGSHLNSDHGPHDLQSAMVEIEKEVIKMMDRVTVLEQQLAVERYRNQGTTPWGRSIGTALVKE